MKLMIRAHDLAVKGVENIAAALGAQELDGIQLVGYKSVNEIEYKRGSVTAEQAKNTNKILTSNNKEIALLGAYFNPVHPNEEKRKLGFDIFSEYLSLANDFGAPAVGSETGSYMGDPWGYHPKNSSDEALDTVVDTFKRLADIAEKHGTSIAVEGAFNHVCSSPKRLYRAAERIGKSNLKFIFDLYNYLDYSNVGEMYRILDEGISVFSESILLYHIKDFTVSDGKLIQCGVGRGVTDFDRVLKAIYKQNKDAVLVLEGTVGDDIPYAVSHLRKIIAKLG